MVFVIPGAREKIGKVEHAGGALRMRFATACHSGRAIKCHVMVVAVRAWPRMCCIPDARNGSAEVHSARPGKQRQACMQARGMQGP